MEAQSNEAPSTVGSLTVGAGLLAPFWSDKVGATGMTWDSGCIPEVNFLGHCHTVLWEPFFSKQLNCVPFFLVCFLGSIP